MESHVHAKVLVIELIHKTIIMSHESVGSVPNVEAQFLTTPLKTKRCHVPDATVLNLNSSNDRPIWLTDTFVGARFERDIFRQCGPAWKQVCDHFHRI